MKYLNTDVELIVIDRLFLKKQTFNVYIRIIITSLNVRDLKIIKHKINEYVLIFICIYDKDNIINKKVRVCFMKEMHIIDDLKINIFINNNIDKFENIIIFIESYIAYIDYCDVIVSLKVKIIEIVIAKSVHLRKIIVILLRTNFSIEIHHLIVLNKKYFFELKKILNLIAYAYLINVFIKTILFYNKFNISMQVPRNYCLKKLLK